MSSRSGNSHLTTPSVAAQKVTRAVMAAADDSDNSDSNSRHRGANRKDKRRSKRSRWSAGSKSTAAASAVNSGKLLPGPSSSATASAVTATTQNPLSRSLLEQKTPPALSQTLSSAFKSSGGATATDCCGHSLRTNQSSCGSSKKSSQALSDDTPTLHPAEGGTDRQQVGGGAEGSGGAFKTGPPHERRETELEKQLKQERRHLVSKLDDISQKHQAALKANGEMRKKMASLEAELEIRTRKPSEEEDDIVPKVEYNLKLDAMTRELEALRTDKEEVEFALSSANACLSEAKASLSEAKRDQQELEEEASVQRESFKSEIESLREEVAQFADEKEKLLTLEGVRKEKMDQLEKLTTKKEVANILLEKEVCNYKRQVDDLNKLLAGKNRELDRLNDEVHQRREGQLFVENTFKGLGQIVNILTRDNTAANQRHRANLEEIAKLKSYMASNLFFDSEE